jgi:hypothetical protein
LSMIMISSSGSRKDEEWAEGGISVQLRPAAPWSVRTTFRLI